MVLRGRAPERDPRLAGTGGVNAWLPGIGCAQGLRAGVPQGVDVAKLQGHRTRSAVFLVHFEGAGRRRADQEKNSSARRHSLKKRMLSQPECERPVTRGTIPGANAAGAAPATLSRYHRIRGSRLE